MKVTKSPPLNLDSDPLVNDTNADQPVTAVSSASGLTSPPDTGPWLGAKKQKRAKPKQRWTYPIAFLASILWIGSLIAFVLGFQSRVGPFDFDPFILGIFTLLALGPLGFVFFAAYALGQGQWFGDEARRTQTLADHMITPAAIAIGDTSLLLEKIRSEITAAATAANLARDEIGALGKVLAVETQRLTEAAADSTKSAYEMSTALGQERNALGAMSKTLDDQVARINEAVTRNARLIVDASEVADTQIREAENILAARTIDLSAAANDAAATARLASDGIGAEIERLNTAGLQFNDQVHGVQDALARQVDVLNETALGLRNEQDQLDSALVARRAQLADMIAQSRDAADAVNQTTHDATQQMERLSQISKERAEELNEAARNHRAALASAAIESLSAIADASSRHRDLLLEQTQDLIDTMNQAAQQAQASAEAHINTANNQLSQMSEAAFGAGQQAEAMFAARLDDARTLIEQSVRLAEEAGARSAEQLSRNLGSTRDAVNQFADLLADFEHRIGTLPNEANRQAQLASERLAEGIASGIAHMAEAAKKVAEETLAIDARFQERVRKNYQALGEAVRQLEQVASVTKATLAAQVAAKDAVTQTSTAPRPALQRPSPPRPPVQPPGPTEAERPRLRLTPTESDTQVSSVFDRARPIAAKEDPVSWKDLLTAIDDKPVDDEQLADQMVQEIRLLQIDTPNMLPRPQIDEIAALINKNDLRDARNRVKQAAGSIVQQLARRLASNPALSAKVRRFVSRQSAVLASAAARDRDGFLTATLLANEQGRVFLLMEAALSELI